MKKQFLLLITLVATVSLQAQDLYSKISNKSSVVVSVNGAVLLDKISTTEIENSLLFKELVHEMFRGQALNKPSQFSDVGIDVNDKFIFVIENNDDITFYYFAYKIENINAFENFVKSTKGENTAVRSVNDLTLIDYDYRHKLLWNGTYAFFVKADYSGEEFSADAYITKEGKVKGLITRYRLIVENGESVVTSNSLTLGLKSSVSVALTSPIKGISFENLSSSYDPTVYTSPVSFAGTVNLSKITLILLLGTVAPFFLTILE